MKYLLSWLQPFEAQIPPSHPPTDNLLSYVLWCAVAIVSALGTTVYTLFQVNERKNTKAIEDLKEQFKESTKINQERMTLIETRSRKCEEEKHELMCKLLEHDKAIREIKKEVRT